MESFRNVLYKGNLIDMIFLGDSLTWRNGRIGVRLDRYLMLSGK